MTDLVQGLSTTTEHQHSRWVINLGMLVVAAILWIIQIADYVNGTVDDVFITLRVAHNVISGNGYVYNSGENIEGYSNWSWVTLISLAGKIAGADSTSIEMLWIAKILAIGFALLSLIVIYRLARELTDSSFFASAAILLASSTTTFGFWSVCGLETPLVLFLVSLSLLLFYRIRTSDGYWQPIVLGLVLASLAITRPEGAAYGVVLLVTLYLLDRRSIPSFALIALCFFLPLIVYLTWRYQTYGMLLPNTYYAKIGGGYRRFLIGFKYDLESLLACLGLLLFFLPFAFRKFVGLVMPSNSQKDTLLLAALFSLFGYSFAFYSGGDWMPAYRFIMPVLGATIILGICGFDNIYSLLLAHRIFPAERLRYLVLIVFLLSSAALTFEGRTRTKGQSTYPIPHALTMAPGYYLFDHWNAAQWLRAHSDSIRVFAAGEAGIFGFLNPQMRLIDLNGLMDTTVARTKASIGLDAEYVMDRNPDCIVIYRNTGQNIAVIGSGDHYAEILRRNARFREAYRLRDSIGAFDIYTRNTLLLASH